ncbi:MAG: hypothetical protein ACLU1W_10265, partial [Collinsella sp.]
SPLLIAACPPRRACQGPAGLFDPLGTEENGSLRGLVLWSDPFSSVPKGSFFAAVMLRNKNGDFSRTV